MATAVILTLIIIAVAIVGYVGVKNLYLATYNTATNYFNSREDQFGKNLHESSSVKAEK